MATITHIQTLWTSDIFELGQTARISISGDTSSPSLTITDAGSDRILTTGLTGASLSYSSFQVQQFSTGQGLTDVTLNGRGEALDTATILRVIEASGTTGISEMTYLGHSSFFGDAAHLLSINSGGVDYVYLTDRESGGVTVHWADAAGNLTALSSVIDSAETSLAGISALASLESGGDTYIFAASQTEDALNVFQVGTGGQLSLLTSFSAADELPIDSPTDLAVVQMNGVNYVLMSSHGSSSLTVLELTETGSLRFVTQAQDTLDTRFAGATTLDTITIDGQVFVAIGGNDGGVSLFQLLPNGQLLTLDTLIDTTAMALQNIEQLEFAIVEGQVELWAYALGDAGLTRLSIDFENIGITATGQNGTGQNDVLTAADTGGAINGFGGDDILLDGAGIDTLTGGAGADLFIFQPDAGRDIVEGFDHREDRLDLSAFETIKAMNDLTITHTGSGTRLVHGDETWLINTYNGAALTAAQLTASITFNTGRVFMTEAPESAVNEIYGDDRANILRGTFANDHIFGLGGDDLFHWSEGHDIIDGASGNDMVSYLAANQSVTVDLRDSALNLGAALGDVLISVENIEGSAFNDTLIGDAGGNLLIGGDGNDMLIGANGDDTLIGGAGADQLNGGDGTDMADYSAATSAIYADLQLAGVNTGLEAVGDSYNGVENLRGGTGADDLRGDGQDNMIIGGLGNDFIMGRDGNDTLIASRGNDIVSGGNGNDVLNGGHGNDRLVGGAGNDRLVGEAGNDTLIGTSGDNSMIGGAGDDLFYDGGGASTLYGGLGNDRLIGNSGNDRLYGAAGNDIMNGGNGNDRMAGDEGNDYMVGGNGWDSFIFRAGNDADTIADFTRGEDRLMMTTGVTHGLTDAAQIISTYASVVGADIVFNFGGGNSITLLGYTDLSALEASLSIIA